MPNTQDSIYRRFFTFPRMVEDLLRGFVDEPWIGELDFSTLEPSNASYVTEQFRQRHSDVVWKVRWREQDLYIYVLLEFQSTVDPFMALRIATYLLLLYEDLIHTLGLKAGEQLPPVLPIVLYNGEPKWTAPLDLTDLIQTVMPGIDRYRPSMSYHLIDERRYRPSELTHLQNLTAMLFLLEQSQSPGDLRNNLSRLIGWLDEPGHAALRRTFTSWLVRHLLPARLPGLSFPEVEELEEFKTMIEDRKIIPWTEQWRQEGESSFLMKLAEKKFGTLSQQIRERIALADAETLMIWGERLLEAKTVDEMFSAA